MNLTLKGAIVGAISGVIVYFFSDFDPSGLIFSSGAGLIYGIFTAPFFVKVFYKEQTSRSKWKKIVLWTIVSGLSYYAAVNLHFFAVGTNNPTVVFGMYIPNFLSETESFLFSGLTGALILVVGFNFLFSRLGTLNNFFICIIGTITATVVMNLAGYLVQGDYYILSLYIIWQGVMTAALIYWGQKNRVV